MKKFYPILMAACLVVAACAGPGSMKVYQTDPLVKVLYTDNGFIDLSDTVRVARGENAIFQFVLTSEEAVDALVAEASCPALGEAKTGWVHDVHNENPTTGADDMIVTPENNYPDPILDDAQESIDAAAHKTIWVDFPVSHSVKAGVYKGKLTIKGNSADGGLKLAKTFYVQVYPVDLPEEQSLKVVNWYNEYPFYKIDNGEQADKHTQRHMDLLSKVAKIGAEYGQNCWLVRENADVVLNADSTDFVLDFTAFDKAMEVLIRDGNLKYLCYPHFGGRNGGAWKDPFVFWVSYVEDKELKHAPVTPDDPRCKVYIQRYCKLLEEHLREKGWFDIYYQHIADEPDLTGTESQKSWSAVAAMIKEAVPEAKTFDASSEIVENQDVSVVVLGDNIATMPPVPEGAERWMYTCTGPRGNFANRFIQLPLIKTRILHWINYKYNECGYLHWGFTYWDFSDSPLTDVTPKGVKWPGGDCYIIYPSGTGKVYPSIRISAMRDGIRDYDLLKLVEAKDPAKAKAWCDCVVYGPDKYNLDPANLYDIRRQMLEFLSEGK